MNVNPTLVAELRASFAKINRIDPDAATYPKLLKLLDACDDAAIVEVARARIKFVSALALNRCSRRGLTV